MKKYKQLKDLPFSSKGSIWEVQEDGKTDRIVINNVGCSMVGVYKSIVEYYTEESGVINMDDGEWFELAGTKEEKELQREREVQQMMAEREYLLIRVEEINETLDNLKPLRK